MKYAAKADANQKPIVAALRKICPSCNEEKDASGFYVDKSKSCGLSSWCKVCRRAHKSDWKKRNPDKVKALSVKYRANNKDWLSDRQAMARYATKHRVLQKLGGVCCKCGFDDERALQFDHINGGGSKERRKGFDWWSFLKRLDTMDVEELKGVYQILCANCNQIKRVVNSEYGQGKKSRRESARNCTCVAGDRSACHVHS